MGAKLKSRLQSEERNVLDPFFSTLELVFWAISSSLPWPTVPTGSLISKQIGIIYIYIKLNIQYIYIYMCVSSVKPLRRLPKTWLKVSIISWHFNQQKESFSALMQYEECEKPPIFLSDLSDLHLPIKLQTDHQFAPQPCRQPAVPASVEQLTACSRFVRKGTW